MDIALLNKAKAKPDGGAGGMRGFDASGLPPSSRAGYRELPDCAFASRTRLTNSVR
jgi:hypothetical protein